MKHILGETLALLVDGQSYRGAASGQVCQAVVRELVSSPVSGIIATWPRQDEPDLVPFFRQVLGRGIPLGLLWVGSDGTMVVKAWSGNVDDLVENTRLGILEPREDLPDFDSGPGGRSAGTGPLWVLVPGLAFGPGGGRLGRGGGYFDRFLENYGPKASGGNVPGDPIQHKRLLALGIGFDCQYQEDIPREAHDLILDGWILGSHHESMVYWRETTR